MSREQLPSCEHDGKNISFTFEYLHTKFNFSNKMRQIFFGTSTKTMKQLLNEGDTTFDGLLYKSVAD